MTKSIDNCSQEFRDYRKTINRVAATMLFFYALFYILNTLVSFINPLLEAFLVPEAASLVYDALAGIVYIISFMLPVLFFKLISGKQEYFPIAASAHLPRHFGKYTFIVLGVVAAAALMNSLIMTIIYTLFRFTPELDPEELGSAAKCVMFFITSAIIPGFVEEFLFRGCILKNLLPYGKTVALVVSSLMFSLMHQNLLQFFYTFVAGLALGWLFLKTGSIWASVLVHMINNGSSVIQEILSEFLGDYAYDLVSYLIMCLTMLVAFIAFVLLNGAKNKEGGLRTGSVYGVTEKIPAPSGSRRITQGEAVRGFFTPLMIAVFFVAMLFAVLVLVMIAQPAGAV